MRLGREYREGDKTGNLSILLLKQCIGWIISRIYRLFQHSAGCVKNTVDTKNSWFLFIIEGHADEGRLLDNCLINLTFIWSFSILFSLLKDILPYSQIWRRSLMMVNWSSVNFLKGLFNRKSCSVMEKSFKDQSTHQL